MLSCWRASALRVIADARVCKPLNTPSQIPTSLGARLENLTELNISKNSLLGEIPSNVGGMLKVCDRIVSYRILYGNMLQACGMLGCATNVITELKTIHCSMMELINSHCHTYKK